MVKALNNGGGTMRQNKKSGFDFIPGVVGLVIAAILLAAMAVYSGENEATIPFRTIKGGLIVIDVKVNGEAFPFILDTGSPVTAAAKLAVQTVRPDLPPVVFDGDIVGLIGKGFWTELEVSIGPYTWRRLFVVLNLRNVRKAYGDEIMGIIGQDALRSFKWYKVDHASNTITFGY